jgi:hypothetical protein
MSTKASKRSADNPKSQSRSSQRATPTTPRAEDAEEDSEEGSPGTLTIRPPKKLKTAPATKGAAPAKHNEGTPDDLFQSDSEHEARSPDRSPSPEPRALATRRRRKADEMDKTDKLELLVELLLRDRADRSRASPFDAHSYALGYGQTAFQQPARKSAFSAQPSHILGEEMAPALLGDEPLPLLPLLVIAHKSLAARRTYPTDSDIKLEMATATKECAKPQVAREAIAKATFADISFTFSKFYAHLRRNIPDVPWVSAATCMLADLLESASNSKAPGYFLDVEREVREHLINSVREDRDIPVLSLRTGVLHDAHRTHVVQPLLDSATSGPQQLLELNTKTNTAKSTAKASKSTTVSSDAESDICRNYNSNRCTLGAKCKFVHRCSRKSCLDTPAEHMACLCPLNVPKTSAPAPAAATASK